jgi:hypothetical protein
MTKTFEIAANGNLMGEYKGANEDAAIDSYARDAGYDDFADLLANVPGSTREEVEVFEIDTDKLTAAVEAESGESVFQDSYGNGIALVKGESYATYRSLADAFGLDIDSFHA